MMNDGGNSKVQYLPSAIDDSKRSAERIWTPTVTPTAVLVALHGGTFHGGWFGELGDALAARGVQVSCTDFPGHGLSDDLVEGLRGYVPSFASLTKEVRACVGRARDAVPGKPLFLLAESMGGLVAVQALLDGVSVDGLVLCGPLLEFAPAIRPPLLAKLLLRPIAAIRPTTALPMPIGGDTFEQAFGDPAAAKLARQDKLVCDDAAPRAGMVCGAFDALRRARRDAASIDCSSVMLMHYKEDCRTSQEAAKAVVEGMAKVEDKVFHILDGTSHQAFQDVHERTARHISFVVDFVCARV